MDFLCQYPIEDILLNKSKITIPLISELKLGIKTCVGFHILSVLAVNLVWIDGLKIMAICHSGDQ